MKRDRYPMRSTFRYFRKVWSPRASYHLARMRHGDDWKDRLISWRWLTLNHVPLSGAVPALDFEGMRFPIS